MRFEIRQGLPPTLRCEAAAIYWQAFGGKLGRVMGPDRRALDYVARVIREDHCIAAVDEGSGALLGLAGFKTPEGGFADGTPADMRAVYGVAGALWRAGLIRLLQNEVDNERFLIDSICVAPPMRGRGIGTALVEALCAEGTRRGYPAIRLDVVETNRRARALYERLGFLETGTARLGVLRHVFGFAAATAMARPLG
ncbi:MAG: GNAT family N-acetyltransferase [Pseudorhodobacter sp.]|nr:GNAT family N-acetyltransferase [Pseudorhodobacter sp.]